MTRVIALLAVGLPTIVGPFLSTVSPALEVQALIPSPYPSGVTGAAPLDPEPQGLGGPQTIMKDPYPQALGDTAQGNPPISRRHPHQRLVPSITKRKYRVERHGR